MLQSRRPQNDRQAFIQSKGIKSETELLALAQEQKDEGKIDLAEYIVNRPPTVIAHLLQTTWDMYNVQNNTLQQKSG